MKTTLSLNYISLGLSYLLMAQLVSAQQFTVLTEGDVVNTPADSRSINLVDVNNDGSDDIFITNGPSDGAPNMLYLNDGTGVFTSVLNDPILEDTSAFDGATFADADNDGDLDAYVVTWYGLKNFFYRNQGDGTFISEPDNVSGSLGTYSETAAWGDADKDGYVDIYVTNSAGVKKNLYYNNDGTGGFEKLEDGTHVNDSYFSRGVNWVDYDNDGDADLFVCNESNEKNNLYRNEGNGEFIKIEDIAPVSGEYGSMSSSWGDVDNDGDLDLFIANSLYFGTQNNQLFINDGNGSFTEVADMPLVTDGGCSYSSSFADFDNDGDLDLFVSNGYCGGDIVNFLYANDGNGYFERELQALPDYSTPCSFGAAWSDLDNNGFQDLVVSTCKNSSSSPLSENLVYMNEGNGNHWIKVRLEGVLSNRSAIGARIYASALINGSTISQMREVGSQDGYCSQNSYTAHFGLGDSPGPVNVIVQWPAGTTEAFQVMPDTTLIIVESPSTGHTEKLSPDGVKLTAIMDQLGSGVKLRVENPSKFHLIDIAIIDLAGRHRAIYSLGVNDTKKDVLLDNSLESGLYLARLRTNRNVQVSKFFMP